MGMKRIGIVVVVIVLIVFIGIGLDRYELQNLIAVEKSRSDQEYVNYTDTFRKEQEELEGLPFLSQSDCLADAGLYLNPKIAWDGDVSQTQWAKTNKSTALPALPLAHNKIKAAKKQDWQSLMEITDAIDVDYTWWDEIPKQYDCWDIDSNSPRMELAQKMEATEIPIPLLVAVMDWNLLRLAEGRKNNQDVEALESLRGWVRLLMSAENLVSTMCAVALLKHEVDHLEYLESISVELEHWSGIDIETVEKLRRVGLASAAYGGLYTPERYLLRPDEYLFPCIVLSEGLTLSSVLSPNSRQLFSAQLDWINQSLQSNDNQCRLTVLRSKWAQPKSDPLAYPEIPCLVAPLSFSCTISSVFSFSPPWSRDLYAQLSMLNVSSFAFSKYRNKQR
jgi:hypothetical protein